MKNRMKLWSVRVTLGIPLSMLLSVPLLFVHLPHARASCHQSLDKYRQSEEVEEVNNVLVFLNRFDGINSPDKVAEVLALAKRWPERQSAYAKERVIERLKELNSTKTKDKGGVAERRALEGLLGVVDDPAKKFRSNPKYAARPVTFLEDIFRERTSIVSASELMNMARQIQATLREVPENFQDGEVLQTTIFGSVTNGWANNRSDLDLLQSGIDFDYRYSKDGHDSSLTTLYKKHLKPGPLSLNGTVLLGGIEHKMSVTSPIMLVVTKNGITLLLYRAGFDSAGPELRNDHPPDSYTLE